ncbi:hypothetical protein Snoj_18990 [Streptomyces nojiriensis]|uniref:Uncharacterized protein n=1 Tax=Streptomyces nojiriensis TaxID=66374 RepID=A0ABQ3SIM0_9ACTN|nr:hypothetical protein [Streptomyces nojiriensis]QTI49595.1 hypothetical protein JYK04_07468 [Streptomyces nojiriensis]GGS24449.1 hypothetical protein GCM10010205_63060 [Streptomyces nojiriensis]GHI67981.1 hypothetical protein Snoj_18990 [Streptomyces nojiriensis]
MKIHRPGRPEDLPEAGVLWARWAAFAVATWDAEEEKERFRYGYWFGDSDSDSGSGSYGELRYDDGACSRWVLIRADGGRAVLFGQNDSGKVGRYEPPIDLLAGAPGWVRGGALHDRLEQGRAECVYWFEGGSWHRAPYPDDLHDDGLDCGIGHLASRDLATGALCAVFEFDEDCEGAVEACEQFLAHAERGTVTEKAVRSFADEVFRIQTEHELLWPKAPVARSESDLAAMTSLARRC